MRTVNRIPGNILPLALLMTLMILLAGVGIGSIVLEGSRRAKDTDDSIQAYYMADAGVERQLFEIRKRNQTLSYISTLSSNYPNGFWVSTAGIEQSMQKVFPRVTETDFSVVDLFDPDKLEAAASIDEVRVSWGGGANMEVGYAHWTSGAIVVWPDTDSFVIRFGFAPAMSVNGLDPSKAYRLRLRAVNGVANNLTLSVYRGGVQQPFPGDITLGAEGTYGKTTQKIAVTMPKLDVLSGLYSYVVFSECELLKGVPGVPACP